MLLKIFDQNALLNWRKYLQQCLLAIITIFWVIWALDVVEQTAIIATLGATTFIVFTSPKSYSSDSRRVVGGYLMAFLVGLSCSSLSLLAEVHGDWVQVLGGGMAVGMALFLMTVTNTEHPPAAGFALGLVFNPWGFSTLLTVFLVVLYLNLIKYFLRNHLIDLTQRSQMKKAQLKLD